MNILSIMSEKENSNYYALTNEQLEQIYNKMPDDEDLRCPYDYGTGKQAHFLK